MNIAQSLLTIGGILLLLIVTLFAVQKRGSRARGLISKTAANVCRCCYEPEAPFPGGVCEACLFVRTVGEIDQSIILQNYECEMTQLLAGGK